MKEPLHISMIQTDLHWEQIDANLAMFEEKIWKITSSVDLIVLPEMFTTGFTMNASLLAEPMNGKTFRWMKQQASQSQAVVVGSYIVKENNLFYNRLIWMQPNGVYDYYDKRHLFRLGGEHSIYTSGSKRICKTIKGWKIFPLICYDLRFPVWSRYQLPRCEYDVLVYVASWPGKRDYVWDSLLRARAIENIAYVIGVNRIGIDGSGEVYKGGSLVLDYKGGPLCTTNDHDFIFEMTLNKQNLDDFRIKFPIHLDADTFYLDNI